MDTTRSVAWDVTFTSPSNIFVSVTRILQTWDTLTMCHFSHGSFRVYKSTVGNLIYKGGFSHRYSLLLSQISPISRETIVPDVRLQISYSSLEGLFLFLYLLLYSPLYVDFGPVYPLLVVYSSLYSTSTPKVVLSLLFLYRHSELLVKPKIIILL